MRARSPSRRAGEEALEAQHAVERLRPVADRAVEAPQQLALAGAERVAQLADPRARTAQPATAASTSGSGSAMRVQHRLLEQRAAVVGARRLAQPLGQLGAPDLRERHARVAQLARRQAEHLPGGAGAGSAGPRSSRRARPGSGRPGCRDRPRTARRRARRDPRSRRAARAPRRGAGRRGRALPGAAHEVRQAPARAELAIGHARRLPSVRKVQERPVFAGYGRSLHRRRRRVWSSG